MTDSLVYPALALAKCRIPVTGGTVMFIIARSGKKIGNRSSRIDPGNMSITDFYVIN